VTRAGNGGGNGVSDGAGTAAIEQLPQCEHLPQTTAREGDDERQGQQERERRIQFHFHADDDGSVSGFNVECPHHVVTRQKVSPRCIRWFLRRPQPTHRTPDEMLSLYVGCLLPHPANGERVGVGLEFFPATSILSAVSLKQIARELVQPDSEEKQFGGIARTPFRRASNSAASIGGNFILDFTAPTRSWTSNSTVFNTVCRRNPAGMSAGKISGGARDRDAAFLESQWRQNREGCLLEIWTRANGGRAGWA